MANFSVRLAARIVNGWKRFQPMWSFSTRMTPQELQQKFDEGAEERRQRRQQAHLARVEARKARNAAWHAQHGSDAAKLRAEREAGQSLIQESDVTATAGDRKRIPDLPADHYLQHVDTVKELKSKGDLVAAAALLKNMLAAMERECETTKRNVSPWYYEQLAIVYRRNGDHQSELAVLERFFQKPHAKGDKTRKLHERLERVKALVSECVDSNLWKLGLFFMTTAIG
jgi:hypothetical protein